MKLFLDLEGTLIDGLATCNILSANIRKIKQFAEQNNFTEATIFSFGLLDALDLPIETRLNLQELLDLKLIIVTKPQIMEKVLCGVEMNEFDFSTVLGKDVAFVQFIRKTEKRGTFILFDDTVKESDFNIHDTTNGFNILMFNPKEL